MGTSVVNLSGESLSTDEMAILEKGLSFIPAPAKTDLNSITESVQDFDRKVRMSYFFNHRNFKTNFPESERLPFVEKSAWEPPNQKIPENILEQLSDLKSKVAKLRTKKEIPNLSRSHIQAIRTLKRKNHLVIKPADKGSVTVVMQKADYIKEAERQLNNPLHYKKISAPIYPNVAKRYSEIIQNLREKGFINQKQANYLKPNSDARPRRFYLLPKIHKEPSKWTVPDQIPPGRPIVSDCSSESYRIAEFIDYHLKSVSDKHPSYLKDSWDFLSKLKNIKIPKHAFLVTLDITSLYTNIQTEHGIESVKKMFRKYPSRARPSEEIIELLKLNLENNDFLFNNNWYLQILGTAMGKRYAPGYANIDMAVFENEILSSVEKKPLAYYRFLDDIFLIWPHSKDDFLTFFDRLNNQRESIKFKYEISEKSVDFLDITVFKGPIFESEGILDTKVYFKPTDTHELLHKNSFHPRHTFEGIIKSQIIRLYKICSSKSDFDSACSILFEKLRTHRGYSARFLRNIKSKTVMMLEKCNRDITPAGASMKCHQKACEACLYMNEDSVFYSENIDDEEFVITGRMTCKSKNVIYLIKCERCLECYIGETGQPLKRRLQSHISNIRLYKNTPVADHFNQPDHHGHTDLKIMPILQIPDQGSKNQNQIYRRKWESYFIEKLKTMTPDGMNVKVDKFGTLAIPILYGSTTATATKLIRETYKNLQEKYPKYIRDKLVIAYKRNKNLKDSFVSSQLRSEPHS